MSDRRGVPEPQATEADQFAIDRQSMVDLVAENLRLREEVALLRAIATCAIVDRLPER